MILHTTVTEDLEDQNVDPLTTEIDITEDSFGGPGS